MLSVAACRQCGASCMVLECAAAPGGYRAQHEAPSTAQGTWHKHRTKHTALSTKHGHDLKWGATPAVGRVPAAGRAADNPPRKSRPSSVAAGRFVRECGERGARCESAGERNPTSALALRVLKKGCRLLKIVKCRNTRANCGTIDFVASHASVASEPAAFDQAVALRPAHRR